jgi:hypothetical protein
MTWVGAVVLVKEKIFVVDICLYRTCVSNWRHQICNNSLMRTTK